MEYLSAELCVHQLLCCVWLSVTEVRQQWQITTDETLEEIKVCTDCAAECAGAADSGMTFFW